MTAPGVVVVADEAVGALSVDEREALTRCEAIVAAGFDVFKAVGTALWEILDRRLYRDTHATWDAYLRDRWGYSRSYVSRLISAAEVAENVLPIGNISNEAQARELAHLEPDVQREVYELARAIAPNGQVTAAHLRSLADLHRRDQNRRVLTSSESNEWFTPGDYVEAARAVLGGIDLDPASCAHANRTVRAAQYFSCEVDGLSRPWPGRVFLNPPYGADAGRFVEHLIAQYQQGVTTAAVGLINGNATDTAWFRPLFDYPLCFAGRVSFVSGAGEIGSPTFGSVFVYLGSAVDRFVATFRRFGPVVGRLDR